MKWASYTVCFQITLAYVHYIAISTAISLIKWLLSYTVAHIYMSLIFSPTCSNTCYAYPVVLPLLPKEMSRNSKHKRISMFDTHTHTNT